MKKKVEYVKPEVWDLGSVTAATGAASCPPGNAASITCNTGTNAGQECVAGDGAGNGVCVLGTGVHTF